ncbi:MAG: hypothetical protein MH137_05315 [Flavobacteriales bacterium]|nr:hypothetical protein [Flavobacteriales bacterium]
MQKPISYILLFSVSLLFLPGVYAQQKMEKESRIRPQQVPANAIQFMQSARIDSRIKWFLEEGIEKNSIEAKFKKDKTRYSIEFDTLGNIEDIEIEMRIDDLPAILQDSIEHKLGQDCQRYRPVKVQVQYTGKEAALLAKVQSGTITRDIHTRFEVVVNCRTIKGPELLEYLFSDKGETISVTQIIFKSSSNLEY